MLGEMNELPVSYTLQVPNDGGAEAFQAKLASLVAQGFTGANVTFPYKQIAIDSADEVNDAVRKVGATNTLRIHAGKISAFNTDYSGFIRGYRGRVGDLPAGKVLLVGAGGVGRAVAFALFEVGATEVMVTDVNVAGAQALVKAVNDAGFRAKFVTPEEAADAAHSADGLVNCTPVGHYTTPGCPLAKTAFGGQSWAFDAVYTPMDTEFLLAAHAAGLKVVSGFDLFFYQGIDAFEIFTGQKVEQVQPVWDGFREKFAVVSELI
jgi:shikimate dehydrogenase